ncbi:cytochrome c [Granulosicoccus antarcticus]|uniref:cytochrome c n=1 Tax=Granulosicoccus antarcticus TaxID=437505 RepID=UPI00197A9205|nr:cytochrome c [Granulosicoccus antarcticus]
MKITVGILLLSSLLSGCSEDTQPQASLSPLASHFDNVVERGQYLAQAGDCTACHTQMGEPEFSGGKAIPTPFGKIYTSNLTSDKLTGLGEWNADEFWQAMHHGKSRDGRSLYPAFPYPSYSLVTRDDSDALFAYLQTVPAVEQLPPENELRFPYNTQLALNTWRALFFRPEAFSPNEQQTESWNRGAYLVQGLGHCAACHTPRGALGNSKTDIDLSGAHIEELGWDAVSLTRGVLSEKDKQGLVELLQTGVNERDVLSGPMAEVVLHSLQYLKSDDLGAMADYLSSLPEKATEKVRQLRVSESYTQELREAGQSIYVEQCADCHGKDGQGEPYRYPALAGNRGVTAASPNNAIRLLEAGGFGASTQGRPRPYGMPSFAHQLSDDESAAVLSYIRGAWGNSASAVSPEALRQH